MSRGSGSGLSLLRQAVRLRNRRVTRVVGRMGAKVSVRTYGAVLNSVSFLNEKRFFTRSCSNCKIYVNQDVKLIYEDYLTEN